MFARHGRPPPLRVEPAPSFRSPGLELLVGRLEAPGRREILDLGPARGVNVGFFSGRPCRLHIEDVHPEAAAWRPPARELAPEEAAAHAAAREALLDRLITCPPDVELDAILAWDLFDYLHPEIVRGIMDRLRTRCRPGTLLFALVSTQELIPPAPARVSLAPPHGLIFEPAPGDPVPGPRHTPLALERMMPGFRLLHSFLLGAGMQDYLFTYSP